MSMLKYYVWLATRRNLGSATAGRVLRHFGTVESAFFSSEEELRRVPDIRRDEVTALLDRNLAGASGILADCAQLGHRIITIQDAEYPERLRNIYDPPIVLYVKGRLPTIDEEAVIGVVGTRSCTPYGLKQAEDCGYELARRGLIVATGMAKGVDAAAALGALRGGGAVIGLLGCGLDIVYPPGKRSEQLHEDVAAVGALISEYPPGTPVHGTNFPIRNRILSGISVGVVVVEAPLRSGALITASRALEQGRDVFAMPGNVDSAASAGANALLRDGAIPMMTAGDIVEEYAELFPMRIKRGVMRKIPLDKKLENRLIADISEKHAKKTAASAQKSLDNPVPSNYNNSGKPISKTEDAEKQAAAAESVAMTLTGAEKTVFNALRRLLDSSSEARVHLDDIIVASELEAAAALGAMTMLEIDGAVEAHGGGYYGLSD